MENAEFVRYGVMHRNTYINSPELLTDKYNMKEFPKIYFAGQITGVEGYVESAASGMLVGIETARELLGLTPVDFPQKTAIGALALYISGGAVTSNFQPMNVNFSIIAPLEKRIKKKAEKNLAIANRALEVIDAMVAEGI